MKEVGESGLLPSDAEVYRALIFSPIPSSEQQHENIRHAELDLGGGICALLTMLQIPYSLSETFHIKNASLVLFLFALFPLSFPR